MENEKRLAELIDRCMNDSASDQDRVEMQQLIRESDSNDEIKSLLFFAIEQPKTIIHLDEKRYDNMLTAIFNSEKIVPEEKTWSLTKIVAIWSSIAAMIAIGLFVFYFNYSKPDHTALQLKNKHIDIKPAGNVATLTRSDGTVVALSDISVGTSNEDGGVRVEKTAEGVISYLSDVAKNADSYITNTISTPFGGQFRVQLSDGSIVHLNAGSSLTYPVSFKLGKREVKLTGEAYFEVAKDKDHPFVVSIPSSDHVDDEKITVLGTHFNINAYEDENHYTTTLLEGKVRVTSGAKSVTLNPGEQAVLKHSLNVSEGDTEGAVAWKNGVFNFSNQPIENVMKQLKRWYNIEVIYQGSMPRVGFWGEISRTRMLSEVLKDLEYTYNIHFKVEGRRVIVMP